MILWYILLYLVSTWQLLDLTDQGVELENEDDLLNDDVKVTQSAKRGM